MSSLNSTNCESNEVFCKTASASSNIGSSIAGNSVADPSTLSQFPAGMHSVENVQLFSNMAHNFQLF